MLRPLSKSVFARMVQTKEANAARALAERDFRAADPLEQAKRFLQSRGFRVFSESVVKPRSKLIVVGRSALTREEVIARAERMREREGKL